MRTCLGCRKARPQDELVRLSRRADGSVATDPGRRAGGRGAYLCASEPCLAEAVRRGRWAQAFRAPVTVGPETIARLRAALTG